LAVKVGDIMTSNVVSVAPETAYKDVVERFVRSGVSTLPVVEPGGRLVGLITEADLLPKEAYGAHGHRVVAVVADLLAGRERRWVIKAAGSVAADLMTRRVVACERDEDVRVVVRRMLEAGVRCLPVVEASAVIGMVSRHDILATLDRPDDEIAAAAQRVLCDHAHMPEGSHVRSTVERGVVTLSGDVRYQWDESIVVSLIRGLPGVIDVMSHLHHRQLDPRLSAEPWMFGNR